MSPLDRRPSLLVLCALAAGCQRPARDAATPTLLSQVKQALGERERKLVSYRFDGVSTQGGQRAAFSFAFRAPAKMRGDLKAAGVTFAFDGRRFVQWDAPNELFVEIDAASAPREKAALFLYRAFAPFVPEGWRAPLLAGELSAERRTVGGAERLAVTAAASSQGERAVMTWLFAPPAMDLVERSAQGGGALRVLEQYCEPKLGLCFPATVEEQVPGLPVGKTELSHIEINGPVPPELFELAPPPGVKVEKRAIAD